MQFYNFDYWYRDNINNANKNYYKNLIASVQYDKNVRHEEMQEQMCEFNRKINKTILRSKKYQKTKYYVPHMKAKKY